jgi:peptidoglycan/xylan/chitin deacetylase (PgdA/CDA1 family)
LISSAIISLKRALREIAGSRVAIDVQVKRIHKANALTILNLHRVSDNSDTAYAPLNPALFDRLLNWLQLHFEIVTFGELSSMPRLGKPALILSFDDGYKDFIEFTAPILAKHRIRVNQNIIPACIESGRPPLNVILQDFIGKAPASLLRDSNLPAIFQNIDPGNRARSGAMASAVLKNLPIAEQKSVFSELEIQFARFDGFRVTPVMTLEEVRQISSEHEIGVHSWEHATMAVETDAYLRDDIRRCQEYCQTKLELTPRIYALPNGSARDGQAEIIRAAGFAFVLAVGEQFSRCENWLHPRFSFHATSDAEAHLRATGRFRSPTAPASKELLSVRVREAPLRQAKD